MTMDQDFPGKESHCNTFIISLSHGRERHYDRQKYAKAKEKFAARQVRPANVPISTLDRLFDAQTT